MIGTAYIDRTKDHQCSCCPEKVGRGFSEAAFGIGPMTLTRCEACEKNRCVPIVEMFVDMSIAIKNGWDKFGSRVGILRDRGATIFANGEYRPLKSVLEEFEEDIDVIVRKDGQKFDIVDQFIEKSGVFYKRG